MTRRFCLAVVLATTLAAPAARGAEIAAELWDRPRSAQIVMAQPAVRQGVAAYHARKGAQILLVYGVRQEFKMQAEELRAWLVALGVDAQRVHLRRDPAAVALRLDVTEQ